MASTRQQLNAAYAAALLGTAIVFAVAFWLATADDRYRNRTLAEEVRRQRVLVARGDTIVGLLQFHADSGKGDSVTTTGATGAEEIVPILKSQWDEPHPVSDPDLDLYVAVFSPELRPIFESTNLANDLIELSNRVYLQGINLFGTDSAARGFMADTVFAARNFLSNLAPELGYVTTRRFGERMMFLSVRPPPEINRISHIVVGTKVPPVSGAYGVVAAVVLGSAILILISLYAAYSVAARSMQPVETMINEVEAITDGRSLHKRVAVDHSSAELARLAATLNAMMERLQVSFTALRTFTADASHELNTPLAVLRADVERAMSSTTGADEQMVALEEALREIRRMSDLVDSLLTLARADEGRLDMLRDRVDLAALTKEVYEIALLLGEDAGLTVKLTTLENATVLGDHGRLRQLFLNLVTNAIKYTPKGGRVELSLSERLDGIAFSVRDTGIGISQTDLAHVFERFWRADHSRSRVSGTAGFGLGLPIGHWIAQAHGGTLSAISKMGKGSTFTVTLPHEGRVIRGEPGRTVEDDQIAKGNDPIE